MLEILAPNESVPEAPWSLELLGQLEWHRFQEMVGRLLRRAGYLPEVAWIRPDGGTALTLIKSGQPRPWEAIVQCAPWHAGAIGVSALQDLLRALQMEGAPRGIYVTSGVFLEEARVFARLKPLELVDGTSLLRTIHQIPEKERLPFLAMTTEGAYLTPSCPTCTRKMERIDDPSSAPGQRDLDVVYKDRRVESSEVDCRSLTLRKRAEVVFMKNVTSGTMTVHGKATGNLVIRGRLHIAAGGCVSGQVSARAIQLDPGGTMEAEARILNEADLPPVPLPPARQIWRCPAYPKCRATLPVP